MKTRIRCLPGARPVLIAADLIQRNYSFGYYTDAQNTYVFTVLADCSNILHLALSEIFAHKGADVVNIYDCCEISPAPL